MRGALRSGARGVNVLVYGPPGTGKTEFCKTLAARLGADLYSVGEADENGDEPARHERLQDLRFAQRLLAGGGGSVLLFDEMEDLLSDTGAGWMPFSAFGSSRLRTGDSKVFMNRLLERAPVPTLWTSNSARETCPTVLRRMTYALELRPPPCRTGRGSGAGSWSATTSRRPRRTRDRWPVSSTWRRDWPPAPSPPPVCAEGTRRRCVAACAACPG